MTKYRKLGIRSFIMDFCLSSLRDQGRVLSFPSMAAAVADWSIPYLALSRSAASLIRAHWVFVGTANELVIWLEHRDVIVNCAVDFPKSAEIRNLPEASFVSFNEMGEEEEVAAIKERFDVLALNLIVVDV